MTIAEKITNYMKVYNIRTLADFARLVKLPYMTVNNFFNNNSSNAKIETLLKLQKAMGISLDDLVNDDIIIDFNNIKNNDYITGKIKLDDNTIISIGRGGKRAVYTIEDKDANIIDNLLERLGKKHE